GLGVTAPAAEGGARWVRRAPEQDQPEGEVDEDLDLEAGDDDEDLAALLAGVLPDADLVELIRRQSAPPEPELVIEDDDQDDDPA
ncbi:MAG: hypothetical protein RL071_1054, partial [Pseudomonadota bacterium]